MRFARDLAREAVERLWRRPSALPVWYDQRYRLPLAQEPRRGLELRRADLVAWHLTARRVVDVRALRAPSRIGYAEMALVHEPAYLESLARPQVVARIFGIDEAEAPVDEIMTSVRLACGGTLAAARLALARRDATVNLLGGFHHAFRDHGGGFCAVNDVAVAVAALRGDGLRGEVAVIDLDAHPPDGLADCLAGRAWIGSLSGASWGALDGVDDTVLPEGCGDARYLQALSALLARMPRAALVFVIAGGDVLAGDALGRLGLSLDGAWQRDAMVARALAGVPSVWLPGGGYHDDAWRVLAGSCEVLAGRRRPAPGGDRDSDPLGERFTAVARALDPARLRGQGWDLDAESIDAQLGMRPPGPPRLLGYYTAEGVEYGLHATGVLEHAARLGYRDLHVGLERASVGGQRVRVTGSSGGREHVLVELVLAREHLPPPADADVLYVHWLQLRHPRAAFAPGRRPLPGQDAPGLGLSREVIELLRLVAQRVGLAGIAHVPAYYHTAVLAARFCRFVDAARQGRFEALRAALDQAGLPLDEATRAVEEGRVLLDGQPYRWEPEPMVAWLEPREMDEEAVAAARAAARFELLTDSASPPRTPSR